MHSRTEIAVPIGISVTLLALAAMALRPDIVPHVITHAWDGARAFWPGPLQRSLLITAVVNVSAGAAALGLLLTALSFAALGAVELLAVHGVTRQRKEYETRVPARAVLWISFLAYATSHCIGGIAASTAIRMRLYMRRGWQITDVVKLIAVSSGAVWVGGALVVLVALPLVGNSFVVSVSTTVHNLATSHHVGTREIIVAFVLLCIAMAIVGVTRLRTRIHRANTHDAPYVVENSAAALVTSIPSTSTPPSTAPGGSLLTSRAMWLGAQTALAGCDWIFCAAIIFVMLPHGSVSFALCVCVFVVANAAGALTHAPGGLGAFDVTVLAILGPIAGAVPTAAALTWYRVIYYGVPFILAGGAFAVPAIRHGVARVGASKRRTAHTVFAATRAMVLVVSTVFYRAADQILERLLSSRSLRHSERDVPAAWRVRLFTVAVSVLVVGLIALRYGMEYGGDVGGWMLRASLLLLLPSEPHDLNFLVLIAGAITVVVGLHWTLKIPLAHIPPPTSGDRGRLAPLVAAAPSTTAHLALVGDKGILFNDDGTAFLMYGVSGRTWVTMGDPVGAPSEQAKLVRRFREMVAEHHGRPVFYHVIPSALYLYTDRGLIPRKIGECARVPLDRFSLDGPGRRWLRRARKHAIAAGCSIEFVPQPDVAQLLPTLRRVSDEWLRDKRSREKCFSLGYFDADYLRHCPIAIVRYAGRVVAFANIWTSGGNHEASVDLMRYAPGSPDGVIDYLLCEIMLWASQGGFAWFDLGVAPLAGVEGGRGAPLWDKVASWAFRRCNRFYSFEGLRRYKAKFDPVWESRYMIVPARANAAVIAADVARLIGGGARQTASRKTPDRGRAA
ncbi:MAG: phosphatidylglycerol lysyltransferase domain-containing protein [Gemmatimonadaceae bacterium]